MNLSNTKNNLIIWGLLLFLVSCTKSTSQPQDTLVDAGGDDGVTEVFQYVSYVKQGDGSGNSPGNAADFLNATFWGKVAQLILKSPVRVRFAEGDYVRAYSEKSLVLNTIGNAKNRLTLEGVDGKTIFNVPADLAIEKGNLLDLRNVQNLHVKNFSFTGDGRLGYAMRIASDAGKTTKDVVIENCSWTDMLGIIYGASGVHYAGTSHVTYLNCTFKRVGIDSHSHHIYNAYGPSHVYIIDSHFEDCTGDYVRFRDNMDYGIVRGSTFVRNPSTHFQPRPFISVPLFNDVNPGDEYFATNYSFTNNSFTNNDPSSNIARAVMFYHMGCDPPGWKYLLTAAQGVTLQTGSEAAKKALLLNNFGIDTDKIRMSGNTYSSRIATKVALGTFHGYACPDSKGFGGGYGDITSLFNDSAVPFSWEKEGL